MKHAIPLLLLGLGVGLAVIIGRRMSTDAMAVVIGVAVGVAASVPTSLLLVALLRRERRSYRDEPPPPGGMNPYAQLQQPNFIVLDPAQFGRQQLGNNQPLAPLTANTDAGMRRLKVIGGSSGENDW